MFSRTTDISIKHVFEFKNDSFTENELMELGSIIEDKTFMALESVSLLDNEVTVSTYLKTSENWQCVQDWIAEVETAIKAYLREIRPALEL